MRKLLWSLGSLTLVGLLGAGLYVGLKPEPPRLTPRSADLRSVTPQGLEFVLDLEVQNPNALSLTVQSVRAHVVLDQRIDLGTVRYDRPLRVEGHGLTHVPVPLVLAWKDLPEAGALALRTAPVPCAIDGSAQVGGESLRLDLPFRITTNIPAQRFQEAAARSLPGLLLEGLKGLGR